MAGWNQYHDTLFSELLGLMTEPQWFNQSNIMDRVNSIRGQLETAGSGLDQGQDQRIQDLLTEFQTAHDSATAANEGRYNELKTGYTNRANTLGGAFDDITTGYQNRENSLSGLLDNMGTQARSDIQSQYGQRRAQADQGLTSRGLGNTTVRTNAMAGLGGQESAELRRHDEGMRQQQFNARSALSGDTLGARSQAAGAKMQLSAEPLGVIERRTDASPSLADIANLTMQLGRGSASMFQLPAFSALTQFTGGGGNAGGMYQPYNPYRRSPGE